MKLYLTIITPIQRFELDPASFEEDKLEKVIALLKQGVDYYQGTIGKKKIIFPGELLKQSIIIWETKE